jgi:hypothetical protein
MSRRPSIQSAPPAASQTRDVTPDTGPAHAARPRDRWFLSFDCATKSFAFALLRVRDPDPGIVPKAEALAAAVRAGDAPGALAIAREMDAETRGYLHLAAGGAVDLVPGKKDKDIPTVERIGAAIAYLRGTVACALAAAAADGCPPPDSPDLNVAVEFQMGPNAPARTIAVVLLTYFSDANTFMVGPAYKNKLWYPSRPDLRHCFFVERYSSLYTANKNHSKELYFDHLAPTFGHDRGGALEGVPVRLRKDFADCVTQVLGFLAYGDLEKAAEKF